MAENTERPSPSDLMQPSLLGEAVSPEETFDPSDGTRTEKDVRSPSGDSKTKNPGSRKKPRSSDRSRAKAQSTEDGGFELERRVGRLEFAEGALVRLRVPVRVEASSGRDVMTDLDVLAIDVDLRLRLSRSILECKSTVGEAGEPDRLLWLCGLRTFVNADRSVLVRPTVSKRGRAVAEKLKVQVLDIEKLEARETAHAWLPDTFAHVGGNECTNAERRASNQLKGTPEFVPQLFQFLRDDAPLASSHQIVSALNALGNQTAKGVQFPEPARTVLAGHTLIALLVAATIDAQDLDVLTTEELKRRLQLTLTLGDSNDETLLELFSSADALMKHLINQVHERYKVQGATRIEMSVPSLRDVISEPPSWIPRYLDLIEQMRANPTIARDILQTAELSCFEAFLGGRAHESRAFDHLFTVEHRQLLRLAVRTVKAIIGADLADTLGQGFAKLNFNRKPPELPDRQSSPVNEVSTAELAIE